MVAGVDNLDNKHANSRTGNFNGEAWRDAASGGFISMDLNAGAERNLALRVRYYGKEEGNKAFSILINGVSAVKENTSGKWNEDRFVEVEYPLDSDMIPEDGKLNLSFVPEDGSSTGGIYHIRLVRNEAK